MESGYGVSAFLLQVDSAGLSPPSVPDSWGAGPLLQELWDAQLKGNKVVGKSLTLLFFLRIQLQALSYSPLYLLKEH